MPSTKCHFQLPNIISKSSRFLYKNAGHSSNTLKGRDSANQFSRKCHKNFQSIYCTCQQNLLQDIILEKISFVSWCITFFRVVTTLFEKKLFQIHQKSKSLELHSYIPIISKIFCSAMQKIVCLSYLFCNAINEVHWSSGKNSQSTIQPQNSPVQSNCYRYNA